MNQFKPKFNLLALFCLTIVPLSTILGSCKSLTSLDNESNTYYNVFKQLSPNHSLSASRHLYGKNNIEGNSITYRLSTNEIDVYADFKLTILELHPKITANLLLFMHQNITSWGNIEEPDTVVPFLLREMVNTDCRQYDIARKVLDRESELFYDDDGYHPFSSFNGYFLEIDLQPVFLNDNYVTYKNYACHHLGGAHPNHTSFQQTYDLKTGEIIVLDDIIKPDKYDQLREKIIEHMAKYYPCGNPSSSINEYLNDINNSLSMAEEITLKNFPLNNPGIHESGLVFSYKKYQLTPGYYGCPHITITYNEIRDCLKEPFNDYISTYSPHSISTKMDDVEYGCWYNEQEMDSLRKTMGLSDIGRPYPIDIYDEYIYRHGKQTCKYTESQIYGTWIEYGHKYNSRTKLTINPDGSYIEITEEAAKDNLCGTMIYHLSSTVMGKYNYDNTCNKLTLKNQRREFDIPRVEYIIYAHPEHKQMIVHSITGETMILADEKGNLSQFYKANF